MFSSIIVLVLVILFVFLFFNQLKFGKLPKGERLEKIKLSPNYNNGAFQNLSDTPDLTEGATIPSIMYDIIFKKNNRNTPKDLIPSLKTNLHQLDKNEDILVWFGHSSYFMQIDGKRYLVDPVLCGYASPFSFSTRAFNGSNIYTAEDIPDIDFLIITHDHWDHLDYDTIKKIKSKVGLIICGLGIGQHFEHWGYDMNKVIEKDWNEEVLLENNIVIYTTPARHFSGRTFTRNKALWTSFVLKTSNFKIFIGGDSGYDYHFAEIGKKFGEFDLAILENGQYNKSWKHIHLMPNEIAKAAKDLNTKQLLAIHNSKFSLSNHDWDEPLNSISEKCEEENIKLLTPMIGEKVLLNNSNQQFSKWWKDIN